MKHSPPDPTPAGGETPPSRTHPLGAYGVSTLVPSALTQPLLHFQNPTYTTVYEGSSFNSKNCKEQTSMIRDQT